MSYGQSVFVSSKSPLPTRADALEVARPVGGVVSSLEGIIRKVGGTWIGWDGGTCLSSRLDELATHSQGYDLRLIHLTEREIAGWYYGFSNQVLWPLLHYFPEKCRFSVTQWKIFASVNRLFADTIIHETQPSATIWVHDYQVALVPGLLRKAKLDAQICFFCHVPFPSPQVFMTNPWWREIAAGMLGSNLIGFHRKPHVDNFLDLLRRHFQYDVDSNRGQVLVDNRVIKVRAVPLGIDMGSFHDLHTSPRALRESRGIREAIGSDYLMLGVDRLDYTKGLPERLRAIDLLFTAWPDLRGRVSLLQIAVPCREYIAEYDHLKYQVEETVRRINNKFATQEWAPVHLLTESVPRERLVAFYQAANLALITPLRDGLNLVAKEYVASKAGAPAMLLLSKLAGVAEEFASDAILVNPHDPVAIARSIVQAIQMPMDEKRERMQRLFTKVKCRDLEWWITAMQNEIQHAGPHSLV